MTSRIPDVAVILAAGLGSRLKSDEGLPKPLRPVAGRALILRVLSQFVDVGLREAVVVIGHRGDEVRDGILKADLNLEITFKENPQYKMSNGLSVLAAGPAIRERAFFLTMSDHVFDSSLIRGLASAPLPKDGLVLAVDRKLDSIYDMDDATKVRTQENRIVEIHKNLENFDAVDTGLFLCSPALLSAIQTKSESHKQGDCSLSDGVKALAAGGLAMVHDVGEALWQDVDTPETAVHAERLFGS
ncbi:MAG: NTP transferase domain-containing protein [Proteobacteria bacterium]|nr:NTP transferase domain-containing protein [Pseudomonadota bacterium]